MTAYYNEKDPYAAEWLRRLMLCSLIPWGDVDERSIEDVTPDDLRSYTQCHFFAGIGVWSLALQRAGWPDDRRVWTGSCPCQPFSAAGKGNGFDDERHLWPHWFHLINQCRPPIVLGEQVASKDGLNWLDLVSSDMEGAGYAVGASDLCAAGFGGAHIRQRLYFVGLANRERARPQGHAGDGGEAGGREGPQRSVTETGISSRMADTDGRERERLANGEGRQRDGQTTGWDESDSSPQPGRSTSRMADPLPTGRPERGSGARNGSTSGLRPYDGLEYSDMPRQHERAPSGQQSLRDEHNRRNKNSAICDPGQIAARWLNVDWLLCRNPSGEPSWRPVEPGTFPLAHGVAARMDKLRAYGNGLDLETATGFVEAVMECAP